MDNNPPPASPPLINVPPRPFLPSRAPLFFFLGGLLVLLVGLGVGIVVVQRPQDIRSKAFTWLSPVPPGDICKAIKLEISEQTPCPLLEGVGDNGTGSNDISSYKVVYTLTNTTEVSHTVKYAKATNYCSEPYGQFRKEGGPPICIANLIRDEEEVTFAPNQKIEVPVERPSLNSQACGSYQIDLAILAIDGKTDCKIGHEPAPAGFGVCQTGRKCGGSQAACQMVSADKDLASIKIGDTVTFTGWGVVSADSEKIDKINFIISRDNAVVSDTAVDTTRDPSKDSGTDKAWKGTQTFKVVEAGSYGVRIRVHWQSADVWKE